MCVFFARILTALLVGGKVFNADYQHQWLDSLQPEDPSKPHGQQYGYGISQLRFGPNALYWTPSSRGCKPKPPKIPSGNFP